MHKLGVRLFLASVLLAACGGGQTPSPEPTPVAAATASATSPPAPTPTPAAPGEPVTPIPEDTPRATGRSDTPTPPPGLPASRGASDGFPALGDTWVRTADGMAMVYVPGGTFPMGSPEDDPEALSDEQPQHLVTLDSFWIDRTEVTNAQFVQFLNGHGNTGPGRARMIVLDQGYTQISQAGDPFVTTAAALERPVVMVTWHGAAAYCQWAGGRLPTEAEWEYAARGPQGNRYPWGNGAPTCELANHGTCTGVPLQVGSHPVGASWCGALDMSGNVWEWVNDWFAPYADLPQGNPTGPTAGDVPVLRGGGWHSPPWEVRAAYRQHELRATGFNG